MFQHSMRRVFAPKPSLYKIGRPDPVAPVWLMGNNRAELMRVKRQPLAIPITLALINTNGDTLHQFLQGGHLTPAVLIKRLDQLTTPSITPRHALLPHPIWHALGEENFYTPTGWAIVLGPTTLTELARYITHGSIRPDLKDPHPRFPSSKG